MAWNGKVRRGMEWFFKIYLTLNQMKETEEKAVIREEQRLRRALVKQGFQLKKSRVRSTNVDNWGGYMIVNPYFNTIEAGVRYDLTLKEVEEFVNAA